MDLREKLHILADAAKYDASCASSGAKRERPANGIGNATGVGICHSYTPDGRCVSLLKILLTNFCIYDCLFCINRVSSSVRRARFTPQEVIDLTLDFYKRNYIEGLFLSSGIIQDPDYTMEQLVEVARSLREEHLFGGYIHLKTIPGASPVLVARAGLYADRLSVNIELPLQKDLDQLAPAKSHAVIESSMQAIAQNIEDHALDKTRFAPAGQSTQMIIGATPATDREILQKATALYEEHGLRRIYYSAFSPIPDPYPGLPQTKTPLIREHRLYQADWLYKKYGYRKEELLPNDVDHLDESLDPKTVWALNNRQQFPVQINSAPRERLLRVPGMGLTSVKRILQARRFGALRFSDLQRMGVRLSKAQYFISTGERHPSTHLLETKSLENILRAKGEQLEMFDTASTGQSGKI